MGESRALQVSLIFIAFFIISSFICLNVPKTDINFNQNLYQCTYVGLYCGCYTNGRGGCNIACSPNIYKILYNKTDCPQLEFFTLAGFSKMNNKQVFNDLKLIRT